MPPSQRPPLTDVPRSIEVTGSSSREKRQSSAPRPESENVPVSVIAKSKRQVPPPSDEHNIPSEVGANNNINNNNKASAIVMHSPSSMQSQHDVSDEPGTKQLLAYANIRVEHQKMKEEMKALKAKLATKDEQLMQLTCQLRRATATKCDLVVACTDMERQMENVEKYGSPQSQQVRQQYLEMLEGRANMEREFMNELQALTNELLSTDRRYMNQLVDKDFTIGQLEEQVRRLKAHLEENDSAEKETEAPKSLVAQTE